MKQIYSDIRKTAFKVYILGGLAALFVGIIIPFASCPRLFKYLFSSSSDLFETPSSAYKEGDFYSCDNNILFDYYCSDDSGRYYVTSTNDGEYMGFFVYNNKTDLADKISDGTYDYLDGKEEDLPPEYLSGKGYLTAMNATEKRYFEDFFEAGGANLEDYNFVYYNFRLVTPLSLLTDDNGDNVLGYFILGVVFFIAGVFMIMYFICGGYKRALKSNMKKYGILSEVLERDMATSTKVGNAYIGNEHVLFITAPGSQVMPYNLLVWAYVMITTTKHTTYGIPTGTTKSYQFTMWDRDRKKLMVNIKDENIGHQILDEMYRRAPYFFTGYNNDLANATDSGNFGSMVQAVDERRHNFQNNQYPNNGMVDNYTNMGEYNQGFPGNI